MAAPPIRPRALRGAGRRLRQPRRDRLAAAGQRRVQCHPWRAGDPRRIPKHSAGTNAEVSGDRDDTASGDATRLHR
jgi:hypothetical protein